MRSLARIVPLLLILCGLVSLKIKIWEFSFLGGVLCGPFFKMINIFACTCPNRSGVGAIDNPDRFEQLFDTHYIPETSEKIFMTFRWSILRKRTFLVVIRLL